MSTIPPITRRRFLRTSGAAATAFGVLPALGWARVPGANDRLGVAVIGTGAQGSHRLRVLVERGEEENLRVVRVCDVYRRRLDEAVAQIEGDGGSGTMEYREVIDDPAVDAVFVATPDHWHARIAIEAMEAGKDVFVEAPLSHTIEQALACRDAVRRTGRVLQVGAEATSDDRYWKAWRCVAEQRIGPVVWSQGAACRNSREGHANDRPIDPGAGPAQAPDAAGHVWWDRWLGHEWGLSERIPWDPDRFFRFRKYFDYGGGLASDLLYDKLAALLLATTGRAGEYPLRVTASGGRYLLEDERDTPDTLVMSIDYPTDHTMLLASAVTNDAGLDDLIRGRTATIEFHRSLVLREQAAWWEEFRQTNRDVTKSRTIMGEDGKPRPEPAAGKLRAIFMYEPRRDHVGNFLDAIRRNELPAGNADLACATMVAIGMGVEAYRRRRVMEWDGPREALRE